MERVPTLQNTIPVFKAMADSWERLKEDPSIPDDAVDVIDAGLEKLNDYRERINCVPVYRLAIRESASLDRINCVNIILMP